MAYYIVRRLLIVLLTLWVASVIIFAMLQVIPGDPAQLMLGINATDDSIAALRSQLGLDVPLLQRYLNWMSGMMVGDFGYSYTYGAAVGSLIAERVVVSLPLALIALTLSTVIAIPVGIFTASRRGTATDTTAMAITQVGIAIPNFWFAILLVYIFAISFRLVPAGGFPGSGYLTIGNPRTLTVSASLDF